MSERTSISKRKELFDLAVARALEYAQRLNLNLQNADEISTGLELWHLKTRFAYRIPLEDIIKVLRNYPGQTYQWQGGKDGKWIQAEERF